MRGSATALFATALLAWAKAASAEEPIRPEYVVVGDPKLGMEGGVRTTRTVGRILYRYEEGLPKILDVDESRVPGKLAGILGRTLKYLMLDDPLAEIEAIVVHEVFGHGARAREVGQQPRYRFALPSTYCTILSPRDETCQSSAEADVRTGLRDQDLAVVLGGMESNYLTAFWINVQIVQASGWAHHGDLLVYWASKSTYQNTFFDGDLGDAAAPRTPGDDVSRYVTLLQDRFNRATPDDRRAIARRLQTAYVWNLADPTLLFATYSTIVNSIGRGERYSRLPLPTIGRTVVYPVPRFNVSPFGAEHYVDLFLGRDGAALDVYGRVGSSGLASYSGAGVRAFGLRVARRVTLGGELDVWSQPETVLSARALYTREDRVGLNVGALVDVKLVDRLGVTARLAYKTSGYLMGQPLGDGLYGYAGLSVTP